MAASFDHLDYPAFNGSRLEPSPADFTTGYSRKEPTVPDTECDPTKVTDGPKYATFSVSTPPSLADLKAEAKAARKAARKADKKLAAARKCAAEQAALRKRERREAVRQAKRKRAAQDRLDEIIANGSDTDALIAAKQIINPYD